MHGRRRTRHTGLLWTVAAAKAIGLATACARKKEH